MFEQPAWGLMLLLAGPWILWSRRESPRRWAVGGLEPFLDLAGSGSARRRPPWSLLAGLAALVAATGALAGPRTSAPGPLVLLDESLSHRLPGWQARAEAAADAFARSTGEPRLVRVGGLEEPAAEPELREALRVHDTGGPVLVLSDRPAPLGLPPRIRWDAPQTPPVNAAILNAYVGGDGAWRLLWAAWGLDGPLHLDTAAGPVPLGRPGILTLAPELAGEVRLEDAAGDPPDGRPQDDGWVLTPRVRSVRVPAAADPRWQAAVEAVWPGARRVDAEPADLRVLFGDAPARAPVLRFAEDPFQALGDTQAVARIAAAARELFPLARPRPRSECAPPGQPADWSGDPLGPEAAPPVSLGRGLAGLAGLFYLGSLLLRRRGL